MWQTEGMSETAPSLKRPRADALKNRQKILEVASSAFEESGLDVSMEAIAKRAGVGAGTLYRNFANRQALVAAVLEERGLGAPATAEQASLNSGEILENWLTALGEWFSTYEGLTEPMRQAVEEYSSPLGMKCQDVIFNLDTHLQAAQKDGYAREGVSGQDLYLSVLGVAWAAQHSEDPQRLYQLLASGWKA